MRFDLLGPLNRSQGHVRAICASVSVWVLLGFFDMAIFMILDEPAPGPEVWTERRRVEPAENIAKRHLHALGPFGIDYAGWSSPLVGIAEQIMRERGIGF
jgi:hypothetical protein